MQMVGHKLADRQMINECHVEKKTDKGLSIELFIITADDLYTILQDTDFRIEKDFEIYCQLSHEDFVRKWQRTVKRIRSKIENDRLAKIKESSFDVLFEDELIDRATKLLLEAAFKPLGVPTIKKLLYCTPKFLLEFPRIGRRRVSKVIESLLTYGFLPGEYPLLDSDYLLKEHRMTLGIVKS